MEVMELPGSSSLNLAIYYILLLTIYQLCDFKILMVKNLLFVCPIDSSFSVGGSFLCPVHSWTSGEDLAGDILRHR